MTLTAALLAGVGVLLLAYAAAVGALVLLGRRAQARALATFVPDCLVLVRRLLGDPEVGRRSKLLLGALLLYLAMPFDVVPDFIPVAGQLDDVLILALVLRLVLRRAGAERLAAHWPGQPSSLGLLLRLAGVREARLAA